VNASPPFDRPCRSVKECFCGVRWGGSSLISLYLSLISGIVVALQYNPAEPFYSTATIELVSPFGSFWRALHYFASQAFLLLLLCHFTAVTWENTHYYSRATWVRLSLSLPVAVLLLFTGYILRDDATGEAAGLIAENIMLSAPVVGSWLNDLLLAVTRSGVKRVYANHLAGLMLLGTWCVWPHIRRYTARWRDHLLLVFLISILSVFVAAPMEPQRFGLVHIAGPWFFLGLQEALRYTYPFWAGIVFPALLLTVVLNLPNKGRRRQVYLVGIGTWLLIYAALTVVSALRG
jgi:ubiquinol-cytochrome c reductase cytochrome b subunit